MFTWRPQDDLIQLWPSTETDCNIWNGDSGGEDIRQRGCCWIRLEFQCQFDNAYCADYDEHDEYCVPETCLPPGTRAMNEVECRDFGFFIKFVRAKQVRIFPFTHEKNVDLANEFV